MNSPITYTQRRTGRGMVLFELIVALSIFTVAALSIVMALDSAFDAAKERNEIDTVIRGLENQLELLHSLNLVDQDLPDDGSGILYHLTYRPEQLMDKKKEPVRGMYRATITATWTSQGQKEDRSVSVLVFQP